MRMFSESSTPFHMIRGRLVKVHEELIFVYMYIYIYTPTYFFRVHHLSLGPGAIIAATWQKWSSHTHNTVGSIETLKRKNPRDPACTCMNHLEILRQRCLPELKKLYKWDLQGS